MNKTSALWDKYRVAKTQAEAADWAEEYEPVFVDFLASLKRAQVEEQAEFEEYFCDLVSSNEQLPWELLSFVLHELGWPRVRLVLDERVVTEPNPRRAQVIALVREAYEATWWGRRAYRYYRATEPQKGVT